MISSVHTLHTEVYKIYARMLDIHDFLSSAVRYDKEYSRAKHVNNKI